MRPSLRSFAGLWALALRRTPARGGQLGLLLLELTVACTLLAAAPTYAQAMKTAGIAFAVREEVSDAPGIEVVARSASPGDPDGGPEFAAVVARARERLDWMLGSETLAFQGPRLLLTRPGSSTERPTVVELRTIGDYEQHVTVLEGALPAPEDVGAPLPLVVGREVAELLSLRAGERVALTEELDTCPRELPRPERPPPPPCMATAHLRFEREAMVAAIVEPRDDRDPFWVRGVAAYFSPGEPLPERGPVVPAFVPREQYRRAFENWWPGYEARASFVAFVDPGKVDAARTDDARRSIAALRDELDALGGFVIAPVSDALARAEEAAGVAEGPLLVVLAQVGAIALYAVFLFGVTAAERSSEEVALLRSRGASLVQVVGVELLGALWTALPAFLAGPLLATLAVSLLGLTPFVPTDGLLPARPQGEAFVLSAGGAAVGAAAAVVPVALVARRAARERRGPARAQPPAFQRYYLDVALAIVTAVFVWELENEGSLFVAKGDGPVTTDPFTLLAPALAVVAAGLLSLRIYPWATRLARGILGWRPTLAVALWRVEREPAPHARLALLFLMAATIGAFVASYGPTVERARRDRALFTAPVPVMGERSTLVSASWRDLEAGLASVEGLDRASLVHRSVHSLATVGSAGTPVKVLALDPAAVSELLWFREDFAPGGLRPLLAALAGPGALPGIRLPSDAIAISLWTNSAATREQVTLWARVRDAEGRFALLEFGKLDTTGWRELRAPLASATSSLRPPLELVALLMTEPPNQFNASEAPLYLDDLAAVRPDGSVTLLDGFEGAVPWATLPSPRPTGDRFEVGQAEGRDGRVGVFHFRIGQTGERRGLFVQDVSVPLPVVATASFVARTGIGRGGRGLLTVGQTFVPFEVREVAAHVPTLAAHDGPGIVVGRDRLRAWVEAFDLSGRSISPTEVWLRFAPGSDDEVRSAAIRQLVAPPFSLLRVTVQEEVLSRATRNPLVVASGSGAFGLAFVAAGSVVALALVGNAATAVARRRTEFAVLRALGFTRLQLVATLGTEYGLALVFGTAAGIAIGSVLSARMLTFLDFDEAGRPLEPPFVFVVDGGALALVVAVLAAAAFLALATASLHLRRSDDAWALRMGYNVSS